MLAETSGLLSSVTDYAAVVVAPSAPEPGRVRSCSCETNAHVVLAVPCSATAPWSDEPSNCPSN